LSNEEKKVIHQNGLRILEEVGIRVHNKFVYGLLLDAGAKPDEYDPIRIYLPEKMVDKYVALCPKQFYN